LCSHSLLDAQGGVSDRPPDYLQAFGFGNYWAVHSSQLDYLLMAKPDKLLAAGSGKAPIYSPGSKNLAEVLWLIGHTSSTSEAIRRLPQQFLRHRPRARAPGLHLPPGKAGGQRAGERVGPGHRAPRQRTGTIPDTCQEATSSPGVRQPKCRGPLGFGLREKQLTPAVRADVATASVALRKSRAMPQPVVNPAACADCRKSSGADSVLTW
jgi:hypothetical protein